MEELQRSQASRRGHLTKLPQKSMEIIANHEAMEAFTRALAETTLEQLRRKRDVLQ